MTHSPSPADAHSALTTKAQARAHGLAARKAITPEQRATMAEHCALEGVKIARKALARTIALYMPITTEVDRPYYPMAWEMGPGFSKTDK